MGRSPTNRRKTHLIRAEGDTHIRYTTVLNLEYPPFTVPPFSVNGAVGYIATVATVAGLAVAPTKIQLIRREQHQMTANPALLTVQPDFTHQAMPSKPATLADFAEPRANQPVLSFASD